MAHKARLQLAELDIEVGQYDRAVKLAETVIGKVVDENAASCAISDRQAVLLVGQFAARQ